MIEHMGDTRRDNEVFTTNDIRVGSYIEHRRRHIVTVEMRITTHTARPDTQRLTINHEPITNWSRFAMTSMTRDSRAKYAHSAGQGREELLRITECAPGFNVGKLHELYALWDRWHLNDMNAGCVHQPPESVVWENEPYRRVDLKNTPPCPDTGYRYGSAWLIEPLPSDVIMRAQELITRS